jgi:L-aspartate oxidase
MSTTASQRISCDYLVIGSGIAGLTAALKAAEAGTVRVITKKAATDCNTAWAQGGVACVMTDEDSFDAHLQDTVAAGAGLCDGDAARAVIEAGPNRIQDLIDWGVRFTRRSEMDSDVADGDAYDLGREGGHLLRRVLHCEDMTGREIIRVLLQRCLDHPQITLHENYQAVDLIATRRLGWDGPNRCLGAYVLERGTHTVHTMLSRFLVLATGGAGKVYLYTSNPDVACGEGVAMAYRAYAEIANMEFFQFHPTCLYHPNAKSFLISEAVRGEGGVLKRRHGDRFEPFMEDYHELESLAPRDIVARAIDRELKKSGHPCVYLDITHHDRDFLQRRFPTIFATCLEYGIDMGKDPIPVVPAAHYCCGGVDTDVNGVTCVEGLYAAGECGCTGLHGANRLASNSLLEALVVAHNAVIHSRQVVADIDDSHLTDTGARRVPDWTPGRAVDADELIIIYHNWDEIRRFMWDYVGIFRTSKRLQRAKSRIRNIRKEIEHFYWDFLLTADLVELRNMASVAEMIIDSALSRHGSIGLHYNEDYPVVTPDQTQPRTIVRRPGFERTLH